VKPFAVVALIIGTLSPVDGDGRVSSSSLLCTYPATSLGPSAQLHLALDLIVEPSAELIPWWPLTSTGMDFMWPLWCLEVFEPTVYFIQKSELQACLDKAKTLLAAACCGGLVDGHLPRTPASPFTSAPPCSPFLSAGS
jgi:hypothetical protein